MSTEKKGAHAKLEGGDSHSSGPEKNSWRTRDRRTRLILFGLAVLLLFVYLIPDIFFSVHIGRAAVVWYRFFGGTDVNDVRGEGLRVKWPWDLAYIYDIRLQQVTQVFPVLSTDGLHIEVEVSIRFRPLKEGLGHLQKHVGPEYVERLIMPELGSHVRERISQYRPAELYSLRRDEVQRQILEDLDQGLRIDHTPDHQDTHVIHVEDVLIRDIKLPMKVADAIEDKLAQEQRVLEYNFRLEKEEKERERKALEALGIRQFQEIVAGGISERYLQWKGIDATLELARSDNAKIVVIGAGKDGLPIILGGLEGVSASVSSAASSPSSTAPVSTGPSSAGAPTSTAAPIEQPPP